ncbi:MAG: hypothetical protein HAW58_05890 [Candidatus Thioglobus sp.]|nr:hypothetical protein [Candidatus Thioglobus sp.]
MPPRIQNQVKEKLQILKQDRQLLLQNIKPLTNLSPISHRARIGSYRLLLSFDKNNQRYAVLKIAHRKEIYQ